MLEISGALSALRGAVDIVKTAAQARDAAKLDEALADISAKLLDTQGIALGLMEENRRLQLALHAVEEKVQHLEAAAKERVACVLKELRPGAFAYAAEAETGEGKTTRYYLCQPCYDKSIKSILRHTPSNAYTVGKWACPEEGSHCIFERQ